MHRYVDIHRYIDAHIHINANMHVNMHTCIHPSTYKYTYKYTYTCSFYMYIYMCICIRTYRPSVPIWIRYHLVDWLLALFGVEKWVGEFRKMLIKCWWGAKPPIVQWRPGQGVPAEPQFTQSGSSWPRNKLPIWPENSLIMLSVHMRAWYTNYVYYVPVRLTITTTTTTTTNYNYNYNNFYYNYYNYNDNNYDDDYYYYTITPTIT